MSHRTLLVYWKKIHDHKIDYNVGPFPIKWNIWTSPLPDIKRTKAHQSPNYRFPNAINGTSTSLHPLLHEVRISFCPKQPTVLLLVVMMVIKNWHSLALRTKTVFCVGVFDSSETGTHHYEVASLERRWYGEARRIWRHRLEQSVF
jgi:hypothetical protein